MFEMIGLLIATGFLFALAALASAILAGLTWLYVRKRRAPRIRLMLAAAVIPIVSAAYFWLCIALLPDESLFGDIDQPLPNGYALKALGKMPDFASIDNPKTPYSYNGLSECIARRRPVQSSVWQFRARVKRAILHLRHSRWQER
jgi:hypothetical protein